VSRIDEVLVRHLFSLMRHCTVSSDTHPGPRTTDHPKRGNSRWPEQLIVQAPRKPDRFSNYPALLSIGQSTVPPNLHYEAKKLHHFIHNLYSPITR